MSARKQQIPKLVHRPTVKRRFRPLKRFHRYLEYLPIKIPHSDLQTQARHWQMYTSAVEKIIAGYPCGEPFV